MAKRPELFYREDIAGMWVFLRDGDNEILITERPIGSPGTKELLKEALKKERKPLNR